MSSTTTEHVRRRVASDGFIGSPGVLSNATTTSAEGALAWPISDLTVTEGASQPVERLPQRLSRLGRRAVNVVVALVGLILLSPLLLVIALAVKLSSPGPVLYTQPRVGLDRRRLGDRRRAYRPPPKDAETAVSGRRRRDAGGRIFKIYKFRTMVHQPGAQAQVWCATDDPRITPVGRILRRTRLDELPQLWNVLRGDMNVVGPRPEQPGIFQELRKQIRHYEKRQVVLPGITGWAQINQAYDQTLDDVEHKIQLDLEYISRTSAVEDLMIMARTLPVMVFRRGGQ